MDERSESPPRGRDWLRLLRWPATVVAVAALGVLGLRLVLDRAARTVESIADAPGRFVERVARGFLSGDVTERFVSSIPTVTSPPAGNLEVAVAENFETVTRSDERYAFWDLVPLGRTTVEIRVPVTWRYHLSLAEPWSVVVEGNACRVLAPALRPSLPPAIHTGRLERRVESDWLRSLGTDDAERLGELERMLTEALARRAGDRLHLALVREPARKTVAEFVRLWLLGEQAWGPGAVEHIDVRFADEAGAGELAPGERPRG